MELDSYIIMRKMKDRWNIDFTVYKNRLVRGMDEDEMFYLTQDELDLIKQFIWDEYKYLYYYDNDYEDDWPALFINLKRNKITGGEARLVKIDHWEFEDSIVRIIERAKERELPNNE